MHTVPASTVRTRPELLAHLGGRRAVDRALEEGTWQRVLRGAYVPAGLDVETVQVRAAAARRLLPARCLVSDHSLLWLCGIDVLPAGAAPLEVVVPRGAVVPRRTGIVAREADLPRRDRVTLRGLPALRPARAAVDLMRRGAPEEAVVVADAVQHAGLVPGAELARELARHEGLRGVRQARWALELSDARAESPPESSVRLLLVRAGLRPVPQYEVRTPGGVLLGRVDLALPAARLAIEYDGVAAHSSPEAFRHDRRRQNALLAAGWLVLRYTADDVLRRPHVLVAEVCAAARRAA